MREGLAAGKLSITFRGKKLKGSWALVRTSKVENGKEQWLLLKHRDEAADPDRDLTEEDRSVRSGLTIEDLKDGRLPDRGGRQGVSSVRPEALPGARFAPFPADAEAMQAESRDAPFSDARWLFEPKLDGVRALAFVRDGTVELRSRRGIDATRQYPCGRGRAHAAAGPRDSSSTARSSRSMNDGVPSFELLQERIHLGRRRRDRTRRDPHPRRLLRLRPALPRRHRPPPRPARGPPRNARPRAPAHRARPSARTVRCGRQDGVRRRHGPRHRGARRQAP